jgi:hypothetical protein
MDGQAYIDGLTDEQKNRRTEGRIYGQMDRWTYIKEYVDERIKE